MTDLAWLSAAEAAALIRAKRLSPVELMRATLDRAERSQAVLNAFITLCPERAMEGARAAEAAVMRGDDLPPLHGVPLAVKDLVPTAGVRTTWGSRIFERHVPERDAAAVARLARAGAVLFGKTTTPEFGQQCLTEAPLFGRTRNAWDPGRTSGGSSGGAAVAVAAGIGPLGVATDGGGSTRIPAACNGVVGFKQGLGVVPQEWAQDGFGNISYVTPITRTVADTALMLDAMAGPHPADPLTVGRPQPSFAAAARAGATCRASASPGGRASATPASRRRCCASARKPWRRSPRSAPRWRRARRPSRRCRRGCGGKWGWRSLRLVQRAMTGVGAPAETTPWTRIAATDAARAGAVCRGGLVRPDRGRAAGADPRLHRGAGRAGADGGAGRWRYERGGVGGAIGTAIGRGS